MDIDRRLRAYEPTSFIDATVNYSESLEKLIRLAGYWGFEVTFAYQTLLDEGCEVFSVARDRFSKDPTPRKCFNSHAPVGHPQQQVHRCETVCRALEALKIEMGERRFEEARRTHFALMTCFQARKASAGA